MPPRKSGKTSEKPPPAAERQTAFKLGISAESRAAALLIAKGYRIAARRWRSPVGEIDIVARRGGSRAKSYWRASNAAPASGTNAM